RGPNPSQASAPERNPALQGGVGAISGLKAGVSDHKGSSDDFPRTLSIWHMNGKGLCGVG
ncbi:MAG: hypothetical protein LBD42_06100, partial [Desulfovibrio sp.]|nr:hypothetical protein [Desulfovibrio sp.]